ncbi:MAG: IS4 family transposase [Lentisphaeria bacterium]|nr:IS4 family transposase [Lentisphaeria bacterium]
MTLLPGFKFPRRQYRLSTEEKLKRQIKIDQSHHTKHYRNLFKDIIPTELLCDKLEKGKRKRVYTFEVTFWAFLTQMFYGYSSCAEAVKAVQSWFPLKKISSNTAAYCKARLNLSYSRLISISNSIVDKETNLSDEQKWFDKHVKIVDGTCFQLADTPLIQAVWPQVKSQKMRCGSPTVEVQGLTCMATGLILDWEETSLSVHDSIACRPMFESLKKGDLLLADRAYGSYMNISLLGERGVEMVSRMTGARKFKVKNSTRIAKNDYLEVWKKPKTRPKHITDEQWNNLENEITMRIVRYAVNIDGFRSKKVTISTTLLDAEKYPREAIIDLYGKRWGIEVRFRDIKTTMKTARLSSKTPGMTKREIVMLAIAYNLTRTLINRATDDEENINYERVSFANTLSQIRHFVPAFKGEISPEILNELRCEFYRMLIDTLVKYRPNRVEPRAIKRRNNRYKLLTMRRDMMVVPSQCKKKKKTA